MIDLTTDYRRVKKLAKEPIIISPDVLYVIDQEKGEDIGLWTVHKYRQTEGVQIHADMTTKCRGSRALAGARELFKWLFKKLKCPSIYAEIPANNKEACFIATNSGMDFIGLTDDNYRIFEVKKWAA